jgi:hypothetical protein
MDREKPLRKDGILSRQLGDEWLLYDEANSSVHVINSVAEFVWRMCDGSRTLSDIENEIQRTFAVSPAASVRQDLEGIIQKFADIGVIT